MLLESNRMHSKILIPILLIAISLLYCLASFADPPSTQPSTQPAPTGTEICNAAEFGDLAKVKAILKDNPDQVSSRDNLGMTPLHWAVAKDHKEVAELLLAGNADVNARDSNG